MLHRHKYNNSALHPTPNAHTHRNNYYWNCLRFGLVFAGFQYIPRDVTRAGDNTPTGVTGLVVHVPHTPTQ